MIRSANLSDAETIAEIHCDVWRQAYRGHVPAEFLDAIELTPKAIDSWSGKIEDPACDTVLAVDKGKIVGFATLVPSMSTGQLSPPAGELLAIFVVKEHWRKGHGHGLLNAVINKAVARGYNEVVLWVLSFNDTAKRFYESSGFVHLGETKADDRTGLDLVEERYRLKLDGH